MVVGGMGFMMMVGSDFVEWMIGGVIVVMVCAVLLVGLHIVRRGGIFNVKVVVGVIVFIDGVVG